MHAYVIDQKCLMCKGLSTVFTAKWSFASMLAHVVSPVCPFSERLIAHDALVGMLPGVVTFVNP